jgi:hypothetical protein
MTVRSATESESAAEETESVCEEQAGEGEALRSTFIQQGSMTDETLDLKGVPAQPQVDMPSRRPWRFATSMQRQLRPPARGVELSDILREVLLLPCYLDIVVGRWSREVR